jgi:hypothetical protein
VPHLAPMNPPTPSSTRPGPPSRVAGMARVGLGIATAVGVSAPAVLACTLPATLRVSEGAAATPAASRVWLALAVSAFAPMICAIFVVRGAREGLRAFAGPRARVRAFGYGIFLSGMFVGLSLFGTVLRAATHNRALAGVTFAVGGVALVLAITVITGRIVVLLEQASARGRAIAGVGIALVFGGALSWTVLRFASVAARDSASSMFPGIVLDFLAFGLAALFAARPTFAERRSLAVAGPALALVVVAWGLSALRDPAIHAAIEERAPAFAPLVDLVPST